MLVEYMNAAQGPTVNFSSQNLHLTQSEPGKNTFLVIAAAEMVSGAAGRPPRCTRARAPPELPRTPHSAPHTQPHGVHGLRPVSRFGRRRTKRIAARPAFLLGRSAWGHVNRDRTPREKDSGPSGHHRGIELSSASTARAALAGEWCMCRPATRIIPQISQCE